MTDTTRPARALRELVFARSDGKCQREGCGADITLETFHAAHLHARASGGIVDESNLRAWCLRCNLINGPRDVDDPRPAPLVWQGFALDAVVNRIATDRAATLSAAPGAGKTVFAGQVYNALWHAGLVDRLVVLVPRLALTNQWAAELAKKCHIQLKPDSALERPGQNGVVVTYQSLVNENAVNAHRIQAERLHTLVVLDEVHHIGERIAVSGGPGWAANVQAYVGSVDDLHVAGVLNLSGTLWRSDKRERISTVRYRQMENGRLESLVDYEISVAQLIDAGRLRPLDLYRMGAQVKLSDYRTLEYVQGNLADIDEAPAKAVVASLGDVVSWRHDFVAAILDRLEWAHRSLQGYHVKALIVAKTQNQALAFETEVNGQMRERGLSPLAVHAVSNDGKDAQTTLEYFKAQKRVGVLCTVDMAGEGYDCPEIAVIGYATNKLTALYVRQVIARAMRVTDQEREMLGKPIPAAIVIPDAQPVIEQMIAYLAPYSYEIYDEGVIDGNYREREDEPAAPRWSLDDVTAGRDQISVPLDDGTIEQVDSEASNVLARALERLGVPGVFAPRVIIARRRTIADLIEAHPFDHVAEPEQPTTRTTMTVEQQAAGWAKLLDECVGWWKHHGDQDINVAEFQYATNQAGGIPKGGRKTASVEELVAAWTFASQMVRQWCNQVGKPIPSCARLRKR